MSRDVNVQFSGGNAAPDSGYHGKRHPCATCGTLVRASGDVYTVQQNKQAGNIDVYCSEACFRARIDAPYEGRLPWYPPGKSREKIRAGER